MRTITIERNLTPKTKFEKEHPIEVRGLMPGKQRISLSDAQAIILCGALRNVKDCWAQTVTENWPD